VARGAVAQLFRDAILQQAGLRERDAGDVNGRWSGDGDENPGDKGDKEAEHGRALQRHDYEAMIQVHDQRPVAEGLHAVDYRQRENEGKNADGAESDEDNVDCAVEALTAAAILAGFEMAFVIGTHLRRNSGDIVAPSGENIAYNLVCTMCHLC
jgi:hypothetical protein